jgi:hypothetical protein
MKIVRWAAVAVTVLMSLMNLGVVLGGGDERASALLIAVGAVLAATGFASAAGLALRTPWGRPAVIAVGAANLVGAVVALIQGGQGAVIGLVVSALIVLLGILATDPAPARAAA